MDRPDITSLRLASQRLVGTEFSTPAEIVAWMGAMQAQDFPMAKWAVAVRLAGADDQEIESAINRGEILRTHLLRPTWHFVTPHDITWLLDLTAPQIKAGQRSRDRQLELTEAVYSKSTAILEKALSTGKHLSREDLVEELQKAHIPTDQNRASHLLMRAELDQVLCSGVIHKGKPTYALLAERVPNPRYLPKDEALAALARLYFTSRCPAALPDFTWWSGLPAPEARQALEAVKADFEPEVISGHTCWIPRDLRTPVAIPPKILLLSPYDELIVSYVDRTPTISPGLETRMKDISNRGVFRPIILLDGQVVGTWKRTIVKNKVVVELEPFMPIDKGINAAISAAAGKYARFLSKDLELAL